jgi:anti-anti-sigma factor
MDLQTRKENNAIVLTLSGRLDAVTAPEFEKAVRELIDNGNRLFVMDFGPLDYISSAGLRGLLLMSKLLNAKGGRVYFANVQGNVRSVFDMCGFTSLFKTENSVAEALATLS